MTFAAPFSSLRSSGPATRLFASAGKGRLPLVRGRAGDEDSARRALGTDPVGPTMVSSGSAMEDLARIALC